MGVSPMPFEDAMAETAMLLQVAEANVQNIDAIRAFRAALLKFRDAANVAIADAESEAIGTMRWLEVDQRT